MNQTRFSDCGVFDRSFGQIPVVQGQGRARSGLCTHLGQHAGLRWVLAVPAASSCDPARASGPALCSSCQCSPCARRPRCRSRLCPHAVTLGGSHQGFAVVGALPLAAGCLHLHGRRLPQMPARLLVLKLERRVVGSPKADGGTPIAVGLRAPHCSSATGRAACSLEGPGSCLSPHPGLCCLSDTRHTGALDEIKPSVPLCNTHWQFGGQERRGQRVKFSFCSFLSLVMSFMGKTTVKYNTRASF